MDEIALDDIVRAFSAFNEHLVRLHASSVGDVCLLHAEDFVIGLARVNFVCIVNGERLSYTPLLTLSAP